LENIMRNALNIGVLAALRQAIVEGSDGSAGEAELVQASDIQALADSAEEPETEDSIQARRARLQAGEAAAKAVAGDGTAMPDALIEKAKAEILVCWQEFAGQGGVYDLQKQAQKKLRNISQHILTIARECAAVAWDRTHSDPRLDFGKLASSMFRNAIAMAELYLRGTLDLAAPEAEAKLDSFLAGSWRNYTNQVRAATEAGFDPRDHDTIYALRAAVQAAKEAASTGTRDDGSTEDTAGAQQQGQANGAQAATGEAPAADQESKEEQRDGLDWSELGAIAQGSAKIQSALILLHQAIHGTKLDEGNAEERVTNILNVAVREITKLERREELADDGSDGEAADSDDDSETVAELEEMQPEAVEG
jgi:hypothetical protein